MQEETKMAVEMAFGREVQGVLSVAFGAVLPWGFVVAEFGVVAPPPFPEKVPVLNGVEGVVGNTRPLKASTCARARIVKCCASVVRMQRSR